MGKGYQKLFAKYYDPFMVSIEERLESRRQMLIEPLKGSVLEVGSGTGVNFKFYNENTQVVAIEPSVPMLEIAKEKINNTKAKISLLNLRIDDESLKEYKPSKGFDTIVCTLVLCTVPNLEKTIETIKELLARNGKLIILEHIHSKNQPKAFFQTAINPIWKRVGEGCNLNRNTDELIKQKGFKVINESYFKHSIDFYQGVFEV